MKSALPFHGVAATPLRRICRQVFAEQPLESAAEWRATIETLWRDAPFREERHAAIELARHGRYRTYRTLDVLPLYEELIVTGAWWDVVDETATHLVGELLRNHHAEMKPVLLDWSRSDDLWRRRSAVICQVGFKHDTDLDLLYRCIESNLADKSFWLRKAIGWALRAYAWVDPDEIRQYVAQHESKLSPLSRREALKNL